MSDLQKRISRSIHFQPKTAEELRDEFQAPLQEVTKALAGLLKMELIEKKGHPTKYYLSEAIASRIKASPKEEYEFKGVKLHAVVDAAGFKADELAPQLEHLMKQLKENPNFIVHDYKILEPVKQEEKYHSLMDLTISVRDFRSIVFFNFFFGPVLIEVISPEKIEIPLHDFQNGLIDMASIVHGYATKITELMTKQDLQNFNKKLTQIKKQAKAPVKVKGN